jgi:hypothetical protein
MDQKPIILYLRMKGMALDDIHDDLVHTLGKDAVTYSTVTKYARMLTALSFPAERKPLLPKLQMWNAVLSMRQYSHLLPNFRFRFHLCASFHGGSVFRDPPCTVHRHRHLTQSLRFTVRYLRWVSHFLTTEQKQIRILMAIELLQVLSVQSTRQWHDIVTLDESWIYLFSEHDLMWMAP